MAGNRQQIVFQATTLGSTAYSTIPGHVPRFRAGSRHQGAVMFLPRTIATSFGLRHLPLAPMIRVTLTPAELHAAVRHVEREAREAEAEGQHDTAGRLYWRASALREVGR